LAAAIFPLAAANALRSAASGRPAIQPRSRSRDMSVSILNMVLVGLAALSLMACFDDEYEVERRRRRRG
jgi:hypothetical protein